MSNSSATAASRRGVVFGAIGAVVEWYDLMLYGYLTVVFARVFFPEDTNPGVAVAATLGGFAIGFLMRPLGGLFFGRLGDRKGRKVALTLAITMMTLPMLGTALLPGYETLGWMAPVLLLIFRMIQGFSAGGEFSGTLVFLGEGSAEGRRGRLASVAQTFAGIGILLAAGVATLLTSTLSQEALDSWGWRVAYFFGGGIIVVAIFMRTHMPESPHFEALQRSGAINLHPIRTAIKKRWRKVLLIGVLAGYSGIIYFIVMTYLVTYLEGTVGIEHDVALLIATTGAAVYAFTAYLFGWFSDVVGRRPPLMGSAVALVFLSVPAFLLLNTGNLWLIWITSLVLLLPSLFFAGALYPLMNELLPTSERNAGVNIGYNFGAAILGSTAPLVAQVLINATGVATMPAWYLVVASVLILPVIWRMPETAFSKLEDVDQPETVDLETPPNGTLGE